MVEKFKKALGKIVNERGEVSLFGLFKMDEYTDRWSVIFSAEWADEDDREVFLYLLDSLKSELDREELASIARIGVFAEKEHIVELLRKYKSGSRIVQEQVNGNTIHDGYIIESREESEVVPI